MPNSGLNCLACLCGVLLVIVNNLAIFVGLALLAIGVLLTFGTGWLTSVHQISEVLSKLSDLLKQYAGFEVDVVALVRNVGSVVGSVGAAFIVIGVIVVALSCTGCLGGCCKIKPCLIIYAVIVGLIFLAQLTIVIIWYADSNILKSASKGAMEGSVKRYTGINSANVESLLQNMVQIYAGCCGVNNGSDFHTLNQHWDRRFTVSQGGRNYTFNLTYPVTCCQFDYVTLEPLDPYCPYNNTRHSNHRKGCYNEIFHFVDTYFLNFLFLALAAILGLQLLLIAGAVIIYLSASAQNSNKVRPEPHHYGRRHRRGRFV